jgi:N-acetyl-anhydromuramyl-L-alanine amidase AmpD
MSLLSRLLSGAQPVTPKIELLDPTWLPAAHMTRVILHWTAGSYVASSLDKEHYHFLIDGTPKIVRGRHSISANQHIGSKSQDQYAAHTKGANTGAIGVSICASAGAVEAPFSPGSFPLKEVQWQLAADLVAALCKRYAIAVTDKTVLTHAEVQTNLGIRQNGKWDIAKLSFGKGLMTAKACGDDFRARVQKAMSAG